MIKYFYVWIRSIVPINPPLARLKEEKLTLKSKSEQSEDEDTKSCLRRADVVKWYTRSLEVAVP